MTEGRTTISLPLHPVHTPPPSYSLKINQNQKSTVEFDFCYWFLALAKTFSNMPQLDSSLLVLDSSQSIVAKLTDDLAASLRRPSRRTLTLINKALSYLIPFESPRAAVTTSAERQDLLTLLQEHRMVLTPYIDTDRVENNLRHC